MSHAVNSGFREAHFMRQNWLLWFKSWEKKKLVRGLTWAPAAYVLQRIVYKRHFYLHSAQDFLLFFFLVIFLKIKNVCYARVFFLSKMPFLSVPELLTWVTCLQSLVNVLCMLLVWGGSCVLVVPVLSTCSKHRSGSSPRNPHWGLRGCLYTGLSPEFWKNKKGKYWYWQQQGKFHLAFFALIPTRLSSAAFSISAWCLGTEVCGCMQAH